MEIPVYFSDEYSKYLHLFQFPTKRADQHIHGDLSQKNLSKSFKMIIPLDDPSHYSSEQATHLSRGLSDSLDRIAFVSRPLDLSSKFMVGKMTENGFYLSFVNQISQFYPQLEHLDKMDDLKKLNSNKLQDAIDQENMVEEDAKIVHLSIKNGESSQVTAKMADQEFLRKMEEEKWESVEWKESGSIEVLNQIFSPLDSQLTVDMGEKEYLDLVSPKDTDVQVSKSLKKGLSLNELSAFSLKDRITGILMNSNIISLALLEDALENSISVSEILEILPTVAVCIRGSWIINSELIYKGRVKDARNFLLYLFLQNENISRTSFNDVANLPLPMSKELFTEIADLCGDKTWRLKLEADQEFVKANSSLIESHYEKIKGNGLAAIELLAARKTKSKQAPATPIAVHIEKKAAKSDSNLEDAVFKILEKHQVGNLQFIMQSLNDLKSNAGMASIIKKLTKDTVVGVLDQLCFSLRGLYILKELGPSSHYAIRSKVIDCFRRKKTVSIAAIKTKLKGLSATEHTNKELEDILKTFATVDDEDNWVILKSLKIVDKRISLRIEHE